MDLLPVVLLVLAAFVVARLVQLAVHPAARQNPGARVVVAAETPRRTA